MTDGRRNSSADAGTSDTGGAGSAAAALVTGLGRNELEIVFLGTGAAIPAKYRNVSGIYVNLFAHGGMMLDCGAPLLWWARMIPTVLGENPASCPLLLAQVAVVNRGCVFVMLCLAVVLGKTWSLLGRTEQGCHNAMHSSGEGSYGQLVRRYGAEGAAGVIRRLRCVWISHIHADHHAGLPRLLALRQQLLGDAVPPLPVRHGVSAW